MARIHVGRLVLVFLIPTIAMSEVSASCDVPSRFWCDSVDIALNCGVYDQCSKHEWSVTASGADPVNVALYYESLCPGCKEFITAKLYPAYQKLGSIMDITLVPYGNTREIQLGDHWKFICQHDEAECLGNVIETCAIAIVKDIDVYFPFINCIESSQSTDLKKEAIKCASQYKVPIEDILTCSTSSVGNKLEHEMALKTGALYPPQVPWVTVNGASNDTVQEAAGVNLVKLICDTYEGPKPPACN